MQEKTQISITEQHRDEVLGSKRRLSSMILTLKQLCDPNFTSCVPGRTQASKAATTAAALHPDESLSGEERAATPSVEMLLI